MIYPEYIKEHEKVGVTACSCGIKDKEDRYEMSINHFKKLYDVIETPNVRTSGAVSSDSLTRWNELKSLVENPEVKLVTIASGGSYLYEMLDHVDFDLIKNNPKWYSGSSDPTGLLFTITTNLDMATIYSPCNMSGFDMEELDPSLKDYFKVISGEKIKQSFYPKYELKSAKGIDGYNLDTDNEWINLNGDTDATGVIIGGCIECIKDIIGTKFDNVNNFLEKHKEEGIIWYFDVFAMSAEELSMTLRQFNNAGWFKYASAILIGKVKYMPEFNELPYEEAISRAIKDIPIVYQFDIGHVKPSFTIINGSHVHVVSNDKDKYIETIKN